MTDTVPTEETTQREQAAMKLYAGLMEEAKARLHAVEHAINGRLGLASAQIIREFCYLQFRLLCEVIALGCLTAHGDITQASKLRKEYAADRIIKQLEELHPEFYPRPARREVTGNNIHLVAIETGFLTKAELAQLYVRCGDTLHKGSLKKLLGPREPVQRTFPDVLSWGQKITTLLKSHALTMRDGKTMFLCVLNAPNEGGRAQVAIAKASALPRENPVPREG